MMYKFNEKEKTVLTDLVGNLYLLEPGKTTENMRNMLDRIVNDKLTKRDLNSLANISDRGVRAYGIMSDFGGEYGANVPELSEQLKAYAVAAKKLLAKNGFGTYTQEEWEE